MTGTPPFLSRRDQKALRSQYRKGEKPLRIVQADLDGRVGLLAVTDRRLLYVSRGALRTRVHALARDEVDRITPRRERHGSLVVKTKAGRRYEFWMLDPGACDAVLDVLQPKEVTFQAKPMAARAPTTPRPQPTTRPAPRLQPTDARGESYLPDNNAERKARLQRQLELGTITKAEYEWQMESMR